MRMRLGRFLSSLTKPELEELRGLLNLTEEDERVFNELARGRSKICVADRCSISISTVSRSMNRIVDKIARIERVVGIKYE